MWLRVLGIVSNDCTGLPTREQLHWIARITVVYNIDAIERGIHAT